MILTDKVYGVTIFESKLKKKRGRNKMNCLRCGESVPDDAIFCSKCGSRVDGKKNCVRCGKSIDEGNVYCNYCGARQDGQDDYSYGEAGVCGHKADSRENGEKSVAEITKENSTEDGEFIVGDDEAEKSENKRRIPPEADAVLYKVEMTVMLSCIILMMIMSFFVGVAYDLYSTIYSAEEQAIAIEYVVSIVEDVKHALQVYSSYNENTGFAVKFGLVAPEIALAIIYLVNILMCFAFAVVALIVFIKQIRKSGKDMKLFRCFLPPAVMSVFTVLISNAVMRTNEGQYPAYGYTRVNGSAIAEIVAVSVLMFIVFVIELVRKWRKHSENAFEGVTKIITALFVVLFAALFTLDFAVLDNEGYGFFEFLGNLLPKKGIFKNVTSDNPWLNTLSITEFFLIFVMFALSAVTMYLTLKDPESIRFNKAILALWIGNIIVFATYFVIAKVLLNYFALSAAVWPSGNVHAGGGFITGVVFVAAALLSQFVGVFYRISKKSKGLKGEGGTSDEDGEITAD